MTILRVFKYVAGGFLLVPILFVVVGAISAVVQSMQLQNFCASVSSGTRIEQFRAAAAVAGYTIFDSSNIQKESAESRVATRLIAQEQKPDQDRSVGVEVIVRKPGIGSYACVVKHNQRDVLTATYIAD